ncbi:MAG: peptidase C13 [Hyphomonas sp.]|uniref:C13 family peptidase n=1 Tax=Hyphomonas sp. TaxID=87 RepID=UPI0017F589AB|nr:C13 family peptidase [Hyphomonas sp.]MBU3920307.1 C13 family peptidase [Alphaproteobacteria bacterium]MBA3067280.1 peptidase C13 [Hyphomonas sp.]MBU4061502.1 C13 family peptidase [Alphaproteobacteria bacterium]MBU4163244.1 C13 family peptidase [Alphaproteobacteria bacterium]MBU4567949.1 C13 family peptidase [Alphaproteobacteria bacterium]
MRLQLLFGLVFLMAAMFGGRSQAQVAIEPGGYDDWAVGILAADWRDSNGAPIEAFENARRALAKGFEAVGFNPDNITALSLRPNAQNGRALASDVVFSAFGSKAEAAKAGCLFYFTSHGSPDGMVLGREGLLSPDRLAGLVDQWCGERPTVVIVSACYSGGFVPALAAPNRMVMTAARPDRSSFGCAPGVQYPYFDGCVLEALPSADDFVDLASRARRCVAQRETDEQLWPPSAPQTEVGADVETLFILKNFERPEMLQAEADVSLRTMPQTPPQGLSSGQ